MANRGLGKVLRYLYRQAGAVETPEPSDGQLLARFVRDRDEAAFEMLLNRHAGLVWQTCRRLLPDAGDAEDAFQATFIVLLRRAGSLDGSRSLAGWLFGVARRVAQRARGRAARCRDQERQGTEMDSAVAPASEPDDLRPLLDAELAELPEKYRAPLVLCYFEGKTNEAAARELGWPPGSMASRLARGRELLRERLVARGVTLTSVALAALLAESTAPAAPSTLSTHTLAAASIYLTGNAATSGTFSAAAVALAEGVVRSMAFSRLKLLAVVLLMSVVAAGGAGLWIRQAVAARTARAPLPDIARPAEDPVIDARAERIPIDLSDTSDERWDLKYPLATVGHFDQDTYNRLPRRKIPAKPNLVIDGTLKMEPAYMGKSVDLLLVSQPFSSGEAWRPTALTRKDRTFTLIVESWTDNRGRRRNIPNRAAYLLPLIPQGSPMPEGGYELHIVVHDLHRDTRVPTYHHHYRNQQVATLKFTVSDPRKKFVDPQPATLDEKELKEVALPADLKNRERQAPEGITNCTMPVDVAADPAFVVRAGRFDHVAWLKKPAADLPAGAVLPNVIGTGPSGFSFYASLNGPKLDSGCRMTLRAIEWRDKTATLRVDVWRDKGPREKNIPFIPLLIVPLEPLQADDKGVAKPVPGDYRVEVEWTLLLAPTPDQPYAVQEVKHGEGKFKIE
jgi:RNA polymerase sigma factor (sigma-70 family)